jgi:hypothetical protein
MVRPAPCGSLSLQASARPIRGNEFCAAEKPGSRPKKWPGDGLWGAKTSGKNCGSGGKGASPDSGTRPQARQRAAIGASSRLLAGPRRGLALLISDRCCGRSGTGGGVAGGADVASGQSCLTGTKSRYSTRDTVRGPNGWQGFLGTSVRESGTATAGRSASTQQRHRHPK